MLNLTNKTSIKLYLMRNSDNASEIDAELDRRNETTSRNLSRRKPIKYKMIDFDHENNQWDLEEEIESA